MDPVGFLDYLFIHRSEVFPFPAAEGQAHMDLNGKIYAFFNNRWHEAEDLAFDLDNREFDEHEWIKK